MLRYFRLIIDKESPTFTQKLPPRVHKLSKELLVTLNEEQQAAVLRVLECDDYVLLQGLPGTGNDIYIGFLSCRNTKILLDKII